MCRNHSISRTNVWLVCNVFVLLPPFRTLKAKMRTILHTLAALCAAVLVSGTAMAGGILTNTNQSINFLRNPARDAAIGLDGVYSNPAGVAFMNDGFHFAFNWQAVKQTRTIENSYDTKFPMFENNVQNPSKDRKFRGKAVAPCVPSLQAAYNHRGWSFQFNFAVGGGGGKCKFDEGLGSFEKLVSETSLGVSHLAGQLMQGMTPYLPYLSAEQQQKLAPLQALTQNKYSYESYMRGRQYYFGLTLGVARKLTDDLSAYAGLRGVYATCNYNGYLRDITIGGVPIYQMLDATKPKSGDVQLNCDQSDFGFTPILGLDYQTPDKRWNFAAKYEFKTRLRLENTATNLQPSIGNLAGTLLTMGLPEQVVMSPEVTASMQQLKGKFDAGIEEATGEYQDGRTIAADIPAILTLGTEYRPLKNVRLDAGFHYYFDSKATQYAHRERLVDHNTWELNAGAEWDINDKFTVSAGWQTTQYDLSDEYMVDRSFVLSSNTYGLGGEYRLNKHVKFNLAYFQTLYHNRKTSETCDLGLGALNPDYTASYNRTNHVVGMGVQFDF